MGFPFRARRRIYILPTWFGAVFIIGATLMILIGASYQNNLVNLLAYFSLSLIFIAMIQTHQNLNHLRIDSVESDGASVGEELIVTTVVSNESKAARFVIEAMPKNENGLSYKFSYENVQPLIGRSFLKLRTAHVADRRGRHQFRKVKLSTVYPLGLFRAWSWEKVNKYYFVFPAARGTRSLPAAEPLSEYGDAGNKFRGDDFDGHRAYVAGDSARHIDWKARARGRPLLVKEFSGGRIGELKLNLQQLDELDTEAKLSQMAQWINEARDLGVSFSLVLPGLEIPVGSGVQHRLRCLEALAEYREAKS